MNKLFALEAKIKIVRVCCVARDARCASPRYCDDKKIHNLYFITPGTFKLFLPKRTRAWKQQYIV